MPTQPHIIWVPGIFSEMAHRSLIGQLHNFDLTLSQHEFITYLVVYDLIALSKLTSPFEVHLRISHQETDHYFRISGDMADYIGGEFTVYWTATFRSIGPITMSLNDYRKDMRRLPSYITTTWSCLNR